MTKSKTDAGPGSTTLPNSASPEALETDSAISKHDNFKSNCRSIREFIFHERASGVRGYDLDVFERRKPKAGTPKTAPETAEAS